MTSKRTWKHAVSGILITVGAAWIHPGLAVLILGIMLAIVTILEEMVE